MRLIQKSLTLVIKLLGVCAIGFAFVPCLRAGRAETRDSRHRCRQHGPLGQAGRQLLSNTANGDWIKRTEIPPDRSRIGVFSTLADLSDKRTAALIEEAAKSGGAAGSSARKIADLYNSYMDEAGIEAKGLAPIQPHLKAIAAIQQQERVGRALWAKACALTSTR